MEQSRNKRIKRGPMSFLEEGQALPIGPMHVGELFAWPATFWSKLFDHSSGGQVMFAICMHICVQSSVLGECGCTLVGSWFVQK